METARVGEGGALAGVVGAVLAGGRSERMGREKAGLPIGGEPLLLRVAGRLGLALGEVVVVGAPSPALAAALPPGARVIADGWPGRGPLGGLATALRTTDAAWVFLLACDMPFVAPALVRRLARLALASPNADAVALRGPRGLEPLHAAYARSCLAPAEARLADPDAPQSLQRLLAALRVREVAPGEAAADDPLGRSAFNANTPAEWAEALRLVAEEEKKRRR